MLNQCCLLKTAPLVACSKERLIATVQKQRIACKELEARLKAMEKDIPGTDLEVSRIN